VAGAAEKARAILGGKGPRPQGRFRSAGEQGRGERSFRSSGGPGPWAWLPAGGL